MFTGDIVFHDDGEIELVLDGDGKRVAVFYDKEYGIGDLRRITLSTVVHVPDESIHDLFKALVWLVRKET